MHYRETVVWQKGMEIAREVYHLAPMLPRKETYGMRSQITRAATSIPANISESWTRESDREKVHFLAIAHGSLAETEMLLTWCDLFTPRQLVALTTFSDLVQDARERVIRDALTSGL